MSTNVYYEMNARGSDTIRKKILPLYHHPVTVGTVVVALIIQPAYVRECTIQVHYLYMYIVLCVCENPVNINIVTDARAYTCIL